MTEFISDLARFSFLRYALLAGFLVSIACGIMGSYVVARRISYIAGAIAHSVLGGMGAARYGEVVYGLSWLHPLLGAITAALISALIIGLVSLRAREREDTVIGAVWAIGMAVGILFIFKTPGYNENLMSYLFGNILMVSREDLWLTAGLNLLILVTGLVFYRQFLAVCFDEEFALLRGLRVQAYYLLLLCLIALTIVLLVGVVGIIMVIALLTLPAATASYFSRRLWQMMGLSVVFSILFTSGGLALSYAPGLPAGATIIIFAGVVYLLVAAVSSALGGRRFIA
ncbi:MAG: metal ABC transporter permease [Desulfomonilia bacterium]|jgi:zinc transport system permease protein|nr:metal ABC transporter permease [Pseudomonadota bacterium]HON38249.1 metal ABC transporter permease [Deltaproteobacteria bacterium]HRS56098.1 metal ABC transporter permease [Desulfomonilia bacterium]HPD21520.1 metal ABC transporter permease [Deltaproteobacteria bacterium]HPX18734.1 metal ABC transporter permease [Deltaproteobacteria bacterium]